MTRKSELLKNEIQNEAMNCFRKMGYDTTTLEDIGAAVRLNKTSLYYYYKNKDEIFLEAGLVEAQNHFSSMQKKVEKIEGVDNKVIFYLTERMKKYMHILQEAKVSNYSLRKLLPKFNDMYKQSLNMELLFIENILKDAINEKNIIKINTVHLAEHLIEISNTYKHSAEHQAWLENREKINYLNAIDGLTFNLNLIFKGLLIPAEV